LVVFSEAIYEGVAVVSGVMAKRVEPAQLEFRNQVISIAVDPVAEQLTRLAPDVVVDARMTKRTPIPLPLGKSPLIGLGPGFECGKNAALVVETMRGSQLGSVFDTGSAQAYTGVPGVVAGQAKQRLLRAPASGKLISQYAIGDLVAAGERVAEVGGEAVISQLDGVLRGLVHRQAELSSGQKVGDVDPRGAAIDPSLQSDKAQAVGAGVWRAVRELCRTKIDRT
jgi:xanthine dehydrogenase accessory factor